MFGRRKNGRHKVVWEGRTNTWPGLLSLTGESYQYPLWRHKELRSRTLCDNTFFFKKWSQIKKRRMDLSHFFWRPGMHIMVEKRCYIWVILDLHIWESSTVCVSFPIQGQVHYSALLAFCVPEFNDPTAQESDNILDRVITGFVYCCLLSQTSC